MAVEIKVSADTKFAERDFGALMQTIKREETAAAARTKSQAREVAADFARSWAGANGQVVGALAKLTQSFGLLGGSVLAVATGFTYLAANAAKALDTNAAQRYNSMLDNISGKAKGLANDIGARIVEQFSTTLGQALQEFLGIAETAEQWLERTAATVRKEEMERTKAIDREYKLSQSLFEIRMMELDAKIKLRKMSEEAYTEELKFKKMIEEADRKIAEAQAEQAKNRLQASLSGNQELYGNLIPASAFELKQMTDELAQSKTSEIIANDLENQKALYGDIGAEVLNYYQNARKGNKEVSESGRIMEGVFRSLTGSFAAMTDSGMNWFNMLLQIGTSVFTAFLTQGQSQFGQLLSGGFADGGIVGAANGRIVRRPTLIMTGERSQPEAIVPLGRGKAKQRQQVMDSAGLSSGGVVVNINHNGDFSPQAVRRFLLPEINRQVRNGAYLAATAIR